MNQLTKMLGMFLFVCVKLNVTRKNRIVLRGILLLRKLKKTKDEKGLSAKKKTRQKTLKQRVKKSKSSKCDNANVLLLLLQIRQTHYTESAKHAGN